MQDVGAHLVEAGQYALVSRVVAAHKDGELGIARAHIAAGNRGIQRFATLLFGGSGNALGQYGAGGAHVAHNAASGQAAQHAVFAQRHFFHIAGIAHNGKDHVRGFGHGAGRVCPLGALGKQGFGFGLGAVIYGQRPAGCLKVSSHRKAHNTRANPANTHFVSH